MLSPKSFLTFSLLSATLLSPFCAAADVVQQVPEIVVSATRFATPKDQIASAVTVITREEIEQKAKPTVGELLREVPGVTVARNGGAGQPMFAFLRGAEARHTLVIMDGVPLNDPSDPVGSFDFAHLTTDNIERIEVLRGPQSTLYGSNAMGGVVNIITRKGEGAPTYNASLEGGSYNTAKASAGTRGQVGRFSYSVQGTRLQTQGFSAFNKERGGIEDDAEHRNVLSTSFKADLTDNFSASFVGRVNDAFNEFDDFGADAANETDARQWNGRLSGNLSMYDGKWQQEFGLGGMQINRETEASFGDPYYRGARTIADWIHRIQVNSANTVTLGLETARDLFKSDSDPERTIHNHAIYLQDLIKFSDRIFTTIGARVDRHSQFGSEFTYRIAPVYLIPETGTKLKATYGTGFKAPTLFELYSFFGDINLNPEESRGFDIGFEQAFLDGKVNVGSSFFHNRFSDLIDFNLATFRYFNTNRAETHGVENFISWQVMDNLTLGLNHTWLQTEAKRTDSSLLRRPRHSLNATADLSFLEKGRLQVSAGYKGRREDIDFAFSRTTMPSYATVDVNASWALTDKVSVYSRLDNILDKRYEDVYGYGTPGFAAYVGIRTEF